MDEFRRSRGVISRTGRPPVLPLVPSKPMPVPNLFEVICWITSRPEKNIKDRIRSTKALSEGKSITRDRTDSLRSNAMQYHTSIRSGYERSMPSRSSTPSGDSGSQTTSMASKRFGPMEAIFCSAVWTSWTEDTELMMDAGSL